MTDTTEHPTVAMAHAMVEAIRDGRLDEAEALLEALKPLVPDPDDFLVFPVVIAIQRGQLVEALHFLGGFDDDKAAVLKALCLSIIGEPSWQGLATQALNSPDPYVRRAARQLCSLPAEDDAPAAAPADVPYGSHIRA